VSPNLYEKKSCSKCARTISQKSYSFNTQKAPAQEMIDESLSLHWEPSGLIKSCHRFSWFNAALLNQISTNQVAGPVEAMGAMHGH